MAVVILREVEGSRGVTLKLPSRDSSTSLGMTGVNSPFGIRRCFSVVISFDAPNFFAFDLRT
jgi:hypothetical protein